MWHPIETATKDREAPSVMLACVGRNLPIYCGRWRHGDLGEPQQGVFAWRCDSSGRFANPTHWMPLPEPPNAVLSGAATEVKPKRDV
jgi:hypothetical protein